MIRFGLKKILGDHNDQRSIQKNHQSDKTKIRSK